jgi:hypothetical protein
VSKKVCCLGTNARVIGLVEGENVTREGAKIGCEPVFCRGDTGVGELVNDNRELAVLLALERTGSSFAHCIALFEISSRWEAMEHRATTPSLAAKNGQCLFSLDQISLATWSAASLRGSSATWA